MRLWAATIALLLAGCFGSSEESVQVTNQGPMPATIALEVRDATTKDVTWSKAFGPLASGASESVEQEFEPGKPYIVNVTVDVTGEGSRTAEQSVTFPSGGQLDVMFTSDSKFSIRVVAVQ